MVSPEMQWLTKACSVSCWKYTLKKNRKPGVQSSMNVLEVIDRFWTEMNLYPGKSVYIATVIGSE